ncbi:AMP-binding protein [Xanthobacter sp. DSM 24535]|uniref:AMP-binding protein n=1 Tax=Roseixanthobacter psychrophilus TaxID=3119917 RepID=UPI003729DD26
MSLATLILRTARRLPDRPAVTDAEATLTYAAFTERAARIAGSFRARGIARGARVVLYMENVGSFFECMLGCWIAGLCAVPVNAKLHPREVVGIAADCEAALLITTPGLVEPLLPELRDMHMPGGVVCASTEDYERLVSAEPLACFHAAPTDRAWLFYTSGTTGKPKGAILSHRNLLTMSLTYYADIDPVDERDTHITCAPVSHGAGLYALPFLLKGGHQIVLPGFDVEEVLTTLTRYEHVSLFAAPTMLTRLVNHPASLTADFTNLKTIYYGGAPMYVADLKQALRVVGPKLYQLYGQGESPMTITGLPKRLHGDADHPAPDEVLGSCGFPRSGQEVRVVDAEGRDLPQGEVGEVVVRGDCVMEGYWNNPQGTASALREGWLFTGDVGSLDPRGALTLRDRSKDLIISGGSNIYPREVEEVLLRHDDVLEVSVIGTPHPDWGEEVVAFVVARPGAEVEVCDLDRLCLENIARFKRPKHYRFLETLPKNNYGKVLKTELRRQFADHVNKAEAKAS